MHVHYLQEEAARVVRGRLGYRAEFAMLEVPGVVRRVVIPIVYLAGTLLGKYRKFKDAPEPVSCSRKKIH